MSMIHLIYISAAVKLPTEKDLTALLEKARANNGKRGVTGMLLYHKATFIQVLEGEANTVHRLFDTIRQDSRHHAIVKLVDESITERDFPDWSMGFKKLQNSDIDNNPGFADIFNADFGRQVNSHNRIAAIKMLTGFVRNSGG